MGCALSRELLMVWSIKNSNTRKAASALKMGLLINGPLNVRALDVYLLQTRLLPLPGRQ
jgi:hypothetical protein